MLEARGLACLAEPWVCAARTERQVEVRILSAYPGSVTVVEALRVLRSGQSAA